MTNGDDSSLAIVDWTSPTPPWFYMTALIEREVEKILWPPDMLAQQSTVVRWVRGRFMRTIDEFHRELSAALQFPSYYGDNWDAMRDCLRDWVSSKERSYVLVIWQAEQILEAEPKSQLRTFGRQLRHFAEEVVEPYQSSTDVVRPPTAFHVLFHTRPADVARTRSRLTNAELELVSPG